MLQYCLFFREFFIKRKLKDKINKNFQGIICYFTLLSYENGKCKVNMLTGGGPSDYYPMIKEIPYSEIEDGMYKITDNTLEEFKEMKNKERDDRMKWTDRDYLVYYNVKN